MYVNTLCMYVHGEVSTEVFMIMIIVFKNEACILCKLLPSEFATVFNVFVCMYVCSIVCVSCPIVCVSMFTCTCD